MKIVFFNHWHNGDIHVSRGFIRKIIEKVQSLTSQDTFIYSHKNASDLLIDIANLSYDPSLVLNIAMHDNLRIIDDKIFINTWYAQQNHRYMNRYGMTMDCLYAALDETCKTVWKFSLSDITNNFNDFFPIIDYSKFAIDQAKIWLSHHPEKKIFVANGHALSGQAYNFLMTPIIIQLAQKHPDKTFILTNQETSDILPNNVIYSSTIIQKPSGADLNENSFLSSYCDMIIGRSSGASSFAMTQENLFSRKIKILYFTNITPSPPNKFWADSIFRDRINYSAEIICTNEPNIINVASLIDRNLQ